MIYVDMPPWCTLQVNSTHTCRSTHIRTHTNTHIQTYQVQHDSGLPPSPWTHQTAWPWQYPARWTWEQCRSPAWMPQIETTHTHIQNQQTVAKAKHIRITTISVKTVHISNLLHLCSHAHTHTDRAKQRYCKICIFYIVNSSKVNHLTFIYVPF